MPGKAKSEQHYVPMRYFSWLFDEENQTVLSAEQLMYGVPYKLEWLKDSNYTIEWEVLCQICKNIEAKLSDDDISNTQLIVEMRAKPGLEFPCALQAMVKGQMTEGPKLFGLPPARVTTSPIQNGVRYTVEYADHSNFFTRLRRALVHLFNGKRTTKTLYNELKKEYQHLDEAMKALRESEKRYELLAQNMHDIIWTTDLSGQLVYLSPSISRHTDIPLHTIIEQGPLTLLRSQTNLDILRDAVLAELASEADGQATGTLNVARDITERVKLTQEVAEKRKLESLGLLAGGVAHDLNQIMASAESAAKLCDQMLAFSGKGMSIKVPINLSERVTKVMDLMRSSIPSKAELILQLAENLPELNGDPAQIDQIIMNLALNAAEALPSEGGSIEIKTAVDPNRTNHVVLTVRDTGQGIDEKIRARILEPFYSTKVQGRGMGLAAVDGVVRSYGGQLNHSSDSSGTTFWVSLPAPRSTPTYDKISSATAAHPAKQRGTRILVVDDETAVREVTRLMLEKQGHKTLEAPSGQEALQYICSNDNPIDLVLLDLSMPGLDGEETYKRIRLCQPNVPLIFMSGYHQEGMPHCASGDTNVRFLHKPFRMADLQARVDDMF